MPPSRGLVVRHARAHTHVRGIRGIVVFVIGTLVTIQYRSRVALFTECVCVCDVLWVRMRCMSGMTWKLRMSKGPSVTYAPADIAKGAADLVAPRSEGTGTHQETSIVVLTSVCVGGLVRATCGRLVPENGKIRMPSCRPR